jgi:hypothetical protein
MKRFTALCSVAFALIACDAENISHDGDPVDGPYTLALTKIHETCYDLTDGIRADVPSSDKDFEDAAAEVDVFLRPDGLVDLRHSSNYLPGSLDGVIERIDRSAGRDLKSVDQTRTVKSEYSTIGMTAKGRITPDILLLDFTETYLDAHNDCTFTVHAEGFRRPIADATAFDGYYNVTVESWGDSCSPPAEDAIRPSVEGRVSVKETMDGQLDINLNDGMLAFTIEMPPEGADVTSIAHIGEMRTLQHDPFGGLAPATLQGEAGGIIGPKRGISFIAVIKDSADPDCRTTIKIVGNRLAPNLTATENDYRMSFDLSGDCISEPRTKLGITTVVANPGGALAVTDLGGEFDATIKDGVLKGSVGSLAEDGYEMTVDGVSAPPNLDYTVHVRQQDPFTGSACSLTVKASGTARYVF